MKRQHFVLVLTSMIFCTVVMGGQKNAKERSWNKIAETNPLEGHSLEYKYYAPDIGLLQDGQLKLVKYGRN